MMMNAGLSRAKSTVKAALRSYGIHVFRSLPRGVDFIYDIRNKFAEYRFEVIFDVGANEGQSAEAFLASFPDAKVWCFEPNEALHPLIRERLKTQLNRTKLEMCALGSSIGSAQLVLSSDTSMSHLASTTSEFPEQVAVLGEKPVRVRTLDDYCRSVGVRKIDLLKIDTEGHDLEVLKGASRLISEGAATFIQCECSMNPDNQFHARFEDVKHLLEKQGYRLFGIYEQVGEWFRNTPNLRRVNAVYLSSNLMS